MIQKWLFGSKDQLKSAYFWNTGAAMLNAFQTVFILMLVSRIDPIIDAGVFTIAFAIGNLMMTIGKYGIRQFQVSDLEEKYSFREYAITRSISCLVMILASFIYVGVNFFTGLYDFEKSLVIILVCFAKAIDAFEDVIHGMLQQYMRLDVAGKILSTRLFTYIIVYMAAYLVSKDLVFTSAVALIISFLQCLYLNWIALGGMEIRKKTFDYKNILGLLVECFPLFISSYLIMYISNAPKYAIDKVMSSEVQACFSYIFMPVFVISLLSQFIYQPVIGKMALYWQNNDMPSFVKMIYRQVLIVIALSVAVILGGYFLGIPILSLIYGVDLNGYKTSLLILLIGGGALALVNFLQMIITVARKQNFLIIGYLAAFLAFVFGGKIVVEKYGIIGISFFYTLIVAGIGIIFIIITALTLKKKAEYLKRI